MGRPVGPRGLTVLVIAGIAALLLAVVGWTQRGTGPVAPHPAGIAVHLVSGGVP
jgi:hypothetical protein